MLGRVDLSFVTLPQGRIAIYRRAQKRGWRKLGDCPAGAGPILVRVDDSDRNGRLDCTLAGLQEPRGVPATVAPLEGGMAEPAADESTSGSVSHRELQVIELAALGITARDIGTRLYISPRTVETHLAHAYRKLGVGSRLELVRRAVDFGLTGGDDKNQ